MSNRGLLGDLVCVCSPRAVLPRFPAWLGPSSLGGTCFKEDFQVLEQDAALGEAMKGHVHRWTADCLLYLLYCRLFLALLRRGETTAQHTASLVTQGRHWAIACCLTSQYNI